MLHYKDTYVETQHNRDMMFENVYFSVSVRGWKQMTESFAREHFAHRIKIGWLGLNLSKEQTQIPHSQTLYGSHLRCLWAVVEEDISLSCHLLQKPFSTSTGLWRICRALSKEVRLEKLVIIFFHICDRPVTSYCIKLGPLHPVHLKVSNGTNLHAILHLSIMSVKCILSSLWSSGLLIVFFC